MWNSVLLVFTVPTGFVIRLAAIYMHSCVLGTVLGALHILSQSETGSERGCPVKLGVTWRLVWPRHLNTSFYFIVKATQSSRWHKKQGGWRSRLAAGISLVSLPPTVSSENSTNMTDSFWQESKWMNFNFLARCWLFSVCRSLLLALLAKVRVWPLMVLSSIGTWEEDMVKEWSMANNLLSLVLHAFSSSFCWLTHRSCRPPLCWAPWWLAWVVGTQERMLVFIWFCYEPLVSLCPGHSCLASLGLVMQGACEAPGQINVQPGSTCQSQCPTVATSELPSFLSQVESLFLECHEVFLGTRRM